MDMDQAASWLAGSILVMLGFIIVIGGVVIINNILHKFWKPVSFFTVGTWSTENMPTRFATEEELDTIASKIIKDNEK